MACCGGKSPATYQGQDKAVFSRARSSQVEARSYWSADDAVFEYSGSVAITVWGPVSGRRYRFEHNGARVKIDKRDRVSLSRVPGLKEV